jgi:hypothetical protein
MAQKNYQIYSSISRLKGSGTLAANKCVALTSGKLEPIASATAVVPVGMILNTTTKTDVPLTVVTRGEVPMEVGSAGVTEGEFVKMDATGCVEDATIANTEIIVGQALETKTVGLLAMIDFFKAPTPSS